MPRPKKPGVEPKRRSRNGCWPCKARKIKCGEEKPHCSNCVRQNDPCDYSIRLNWGGRSKRSADATGEEENLTADGMFVSVFGFEDLYAPGQHAHSFPDLSLAKSAPSSIDPNLGQPVGNAAVFDQGMSPRSAPLGYMRQPSSAFDFGPPPAAVYGEVEYSIVGFRTEVAHSPSMPPPSLSGDVPFKRQESNHPTESPTITISDTYSPNTGPPTPYSPFIPPPLTPNSSLCSEEPPRTFPKQDHLPSELRRLSVQSLINGPQAGHRESPEFERARRYPIADLAYTTYGYDLGFPDYDSPRNNDHAAIAIFSPPGNVHLNQAASFVGDGGEPSAEDVAFGKGGYYAQPVPIRIPKLLEPLPALLQENPMNLLYFHHFLDCTARILVPHDCERNPFRHILPEMAVGDENIMQLLLAYSAYHRARMLNQPEPTTRIAIWVQDLFPKLRKSLTENPNLISNNTLAAVIMMASLEIISGYNTFEVPVSWQSHLQMARQMIFARGGPLGMDRKDSVAYFLSRWFTYLDVVGSLSGNKNDTPLGSSYWISSSTATCITEDFEIDCLTGFTNRCITTLARLSELAKQCEPHRIDLQGNIRTDWSPDIGIIAQADIIQQDLESGLSNPKIHKGCSHHHNDVASDSAHPDNTTCDASEIYATNEMFHWAGLIHLYRRVLNKRASDSQVQGAVGQIVRLLDQVRLGSTAEACLIFPMFAAGCDALGVEQRERIVQRMEGAEGAGMNQVRRARTLMRRVWESGKAWEALVEGEFFG